MSAASPPRSVNSSTRSISMSPESARPRHGRARRCRGSTGRAACAAPAPASRWANALSTPSDVVDRRRRAGGRARAPPGAARGDERAAQRLVGPGLELAGAPAGAHRRRAQRVEQHGLADAAQPGEHDASAPGGRGRPAPARRRRRRAARRGRPARAGAGRRRGRRGSGSGPRSDGIGLSSDLPRFPDRSADVSILACPGACSCPPTCRFLRAEE